MKKLLLGIAAAVFAATLATTPTLATRYSYDGDYNDNYSYYSDDYVDESVLKTVFDMAIAAGFTIIILAIAYGIYMIICSWKIFEKAGKEGWKSIIPIYNYVVMCQIAGLSEWYVIFLFIPFVNAVFSIYLSYKLVKSFNQEIGFLIGYLLLNPIFMGILAFSKKITYTGNAVPPVPGAKPAPNANAPAADPWVNGQPAPSTPSTPATEAPVTPVTEAPVAETPAAEPQSEIPPLENTPSDQNNPFNQA